MSSTPQNQPQPGSISSPIINTSDFTIRLYNYLDKLSSSNFTKLYNNPASCLSCFRLLPETARHIVTSLLFHSSIVSLEDISIMIKERSSDNDRKHLTAALSALARLHILVSLNDHTGMNRLKIHEKFRLNLRRALTGGGHHGSFGIPNNVDVDNREVVEVNFLDSYAENQWETILHYMVGSEHKTSTTTTSKPSDKVLLLLQRGELMSSNGSSNSIKNMKITSKGFQFLLEDVNTQLWDFLLEYLEESEDTVEVLEFLFMLGSLELGRDYSTTSLNPNQLTVLEDLCDYGLIYLPSSNSNHFYPTRLATTLTSASPPLVSASHASTALGFLVIETNYKIYAYTSNPLQIAVLSLFVGLKSRFPNLVTGVISRDSVKRGLANGITADQIVSYLKSRAHPQMRKSASLLPTTVVDQIRLWEQEGHRVKDEEGYLYDDFTSASDFDLVVNYAKELGVLIWELKSMRKFFITVEGHTLVREFIKRRMASASA